MVGALTPVTLEAVQSHSAVETREVCQRGAPADKVFTYFINLSAWCFISDPLRNK
jgi:hypothetical protein